MQSHMPAHWWEDTQWNIALDFSSGWFLLGNIASYSHKYYQVKYRPRVLEKLQNNIVFCLYTTITDQYIYMHVSSQLSGHSVNTAEGTGDTPLYLTMEVLLLNQVVISPYSSIVDMWQTLLYIMKLGSLAWVICNYLFYIHLPQYNCFLLNKNSGLDWAGSTLVPS